MTTRNGTPSHAGVDAYIQQAKPFAQPILLHLRECMREAVPEVEEAMKWSRPFFLLNNVILGSMAAFQQHCSFGLWGTEMAALLRTQGIDSSEGMGTFGKITSVADLPGDQELLSLIRQAATLIQGGTRTKSIQRVAKPVCKKELPMPTELAQALATHMEAGRRFQALSPSCRREYIEWIAEAKRDETRQRRVVEATRMISEGKSRNSKYQKPPAGTQAARPGQA